MNVQDYIVHETQRQGGTPAEGEGMYKAWQRALDGEPITENELCHWVNLIKCGKVTGYRGTPVTFANGGSANHPNTIDQAMGGLLMAINAVSIYNDVDDLVYEFLQIHPFADGNGRVASLLWNRLRGSLTNPEPLPYFFGEGGGE